MQTTDIFQLYSREKLHSVPAGNLVGADLAGAQLRYADLRGQDLRGVVLRGACLYGANLSGANLSGADLSGADIFLAHFQGADLRGANFQGTRLTMAQFTKAQVDLQTNGLNLDAAPRMGMILNYGTVELPTQVSPTTRPAPLAVSATTALAVSAPELATTEQLSRTERWTDQAQLLKRAATRKDSKRVTYLAALATARVSAAVLALAVGAYALAPPSLGASIGLYNSPLWTYGTGYYMLLALGSYLSVQPLRDRWYGDSGLPY